MEQSDYTLKRLDELEEKLFDRLQLILEQTTKTNGRVTNLEKEHGESKKEIDILKEAHFENKGRDKVIYVLIIALASIISLFIGHQINSSSTTTNFNQTNSSPKIK